MMNKFDIIKNNYFNFEIKKIIQNNTISASTYSNLYYQNVNICKLSLNDLETFKSIGLNFDKHVKNMATCCSHFKVLNVVERKTSNQFTYSGMADLLYKNNNLELIIEIKWVHKNWDGYIHCGWLYQLLTYSFLYKKDILLIICRDNEIAKMYILKNQNQLLVEQTLFDINKNKKTITYNVLKKKLNNIQCLLINIIDYQKNYNYKTIWNNINNFIKNFKYE